MADYFVDTNVFLRFLTNDDPAMARRAEALFEKAIAGKLSLETSLLVIAEMVWTLESFYELTKSDVAAKVSILLNTPNLRVERADDLLEALDLYATKNIDFVDACHGVSLRGSGRTVLSYDKKHFGRMEWLTVEEP
jgi:predicted nucleic-acid-binding protein